VHDPFHLVQYMNDAVNEVRKAEHRRLSAQGDATLTGTRQLWLYGMENVPEKWEQRFAEVKGNKSTDREGVGDQGGVPQLLAQRRRG
jgi:transposase